MGVPGEKLTLSAFLEWENAQRTRNEFHRGEVFAMVGARRSHGRVVANLTHAPKPGASSPWCAARMACTCCMT